MDQFHKNSRGFASSHYNLNSVSELIFQSKSFKVTPGLPCRDSTVSNPEPRLDLSCCLLQRICCSDDGLTWSRWANQLLQVFTTLLFSGDAKQVISVGLIKLRGAGTPGPSPQEADGTDRYLSDGKSTDDPLTDTGAAGYSELSHTMLPQRAHHMAGLHKSL